MYSFFKNLYDLPFLLFIIMKPEMINAKRLIKEIHQVVFTLLFTPLLGSH